MLVYEYKLDGSKKQYAAIDEAIRTVQFIRNKSLRLWMDAPSTSKQAFPKNVIKRVRIPPVIYAGECQS